ncbi:ketoacyl-synthetase C-terminal extension domain-containing protein, partial [Actinomadura sp. DC4]|nr:ketoacyl-synthetase C-terminal extension domain-containing protein [Actinomadura sp. DC4]
MRHQTLPRTLHADEPSPHVDWASGAVSLLTEEVPWPGNGRPRRAAVSSFGISGTNAHVVIEAPQEPPAAEDEPAGRPVAWVVSARSGEALPAQADRLHRHLSRTAADPADVARTLLTRASFDHRAVIVGPDAATGLAALADLAAGNTGPRVARGTVDGAGKLAFLFSGQGGQRPGMGLELYEAFPAYAETFDEACAHLDLHLP